MKNKLYTKSLTNRFNRWTLFTICFAFSLFSIESAMAVTGAKNVPTDYPTLQALINDLNATGSTGAGVTVTISAGNPQTSPVGGYVIGGAGSLLLLGGTNSPVSINGGLNTITAGTPQVAGSLNDAVIKIVGADNITIFNCTIQENPANSVTVAASNGQTEFGIALFYASPTDGAQNITIRNNDISLKRLYQNSFGIYSSVRHTDAAPTVAADITAASGSNSNLHVYTNAIHNVSVAVASIGSASLTAGLMNDGTDIGGSSAATGNTISDWGNPGTTMSAYVSMTTGSYPCVYSINEFNNNISFNSIVSANLTLGGAGTLFGVFQTYSGINVAPQPTGTFSIKVNNNTFTLVNTPIASGTGAIECVRTQNLGPAPGATISISNNTVSACKILGANATSSLFRPIINTSSPNDLTIDGNIIKDNVLNTTTGQCQLLRNTSDAIATVNIRNNKLGIAASGPGVCVTWTRASSANFFMLICSPGAVNLQSTIYTITGNDHTGFIQTAHTGFLVGASITVGGSVDYNFNTFTNLSLKNAFIIRLLSNSGQKPGATVNFLNNSVVGTFTNTGILAEFSLYLDAFDNTSDNTSSWNFSNNNFSNISFDGVGSDWIGVYGIGGKGKKKTVNNNTFNNISVSANAVIENIIRVQSGSSLFANTVSNNTISNISSAGGNVTGILSTDSNLTVVGNKISNLSTSGALVVGIDLENGTDVLVQKNKICGLTSTINGAAALVAGVVVGTLKTAEVSNNTIGDLHAATANGTSVYGILADTIATSLKVYFNTVHLSGSSTGSNWGSSDISVSRSPYELNNNIFVNACTPTGTGVAAAISTTDATLANFAVTSDRNNYFASTIFTNGTGPLTFASLAAYQTGVSPRDFNSFAQNPPFISTTCSNVNFLHLINGATTSMESGGAPIGGITTDIDGQVRNASTPDIGADEFNGIAQPPCSGTPTAGSINSNVPVSVCSGTGTTLNLIGASTDLNITYQWKSGTVSGSLTNVLGTGSVQATGNLTVPTIFQVTVKCGNSNLSSTTLEYTVGINALPAVVASPASGFICLPGGSPVSLSATGASTYAWSPLSGLTPSNGIGASVSANPIATTTYVVIGTDGNGCTNTSQSTITVSNYPSGLTATATPSLVCSGFDAQLNAVAVLQVPSYASTYSFSASAGSFTPLTGATLVPSLQADDANTLLPIGFPFKYENVTYNNIRASSNGFLSLVVAGNGVTNNLSNGAIRPVIAPLWDDLGGIGIDGNDTALATPSYKTDGPVGSRVFTFEWKNWYWDFSAIDSSISFQAKLYEADNHIEFVYRQESATPTSAAASIGLSSSVVGNFLSLNNTSASPTASNLSEVRTISTRPATGQVYSFYPPVPVVTYAWSGPGLSNPAIQNPLASAPNGTTVYTVSVNNSGCSSTATVSVTAGTPLTCSPATLSSASVCAGTAFTVTANHTGGGGPFHYSWNDNGLGAGPYADSKSITVTTSTLGSFQFDVTVTDSCGNSCVSTVNGTILSTPSSNITGPAAVPVCSAVGSTTLNSTTNTPGSTRQWKKNGVAIGGATGASLVVTASGSYTVVYTSPGGCSAESAPVVVTVTQNATSPIAVSPLIMNVCKGAASVPNFTGNCTATTVIVARPDSVFPGSTSTVITHGPNASIDWTTGAGGFMNTTLIRIPVTTFPAGSIITNVSLTLGIAHTHGGDMNLGIAAPGTPVQQFFFDGLDQLNLFGSTGGIPPTLPYTFNSTGTTIPATGVVPSPGPYAPLFSFSSFNGGAANGNWFISAQDIIQAATQDGGRIDNIYLTITATSPTGPVLWYDAAVGGTLKATTTSFNPVTAGGATTASNGTTSFWAECNNGGCASSRTEVKFVVADCGVSLLTKVLLEGYYIGGGQMNTLLYNYDQSLPVINQNPLITSDMSDTIYVSAMDSINFSHALVDKQTGILKKNGDVTVTFGPAVVAGHQYYIKVNHHNHVETWSAAPVLLTTSSTYNFLSAQSQAYASNQALTFDALYAAMYAGDFNQDGAVDGSDFLEFDGPNQAGAGGYENADLNGDGGVDGSDFLIYDPNAQNGVGAAVPNP